MYSREWEKGGNEAEKRSEVKWRRRERLSEHKTSFSRTRSYVMPKSSTERPKEGRKAKKAGNFAAKRKEEEDLRMYLWFFLRTNKRKREREKISISCHDRRFSLSSYWRANDLCTTILRHGRQCIFRMYAYCYNTIFFLFFPVVATGGNILGTQNPHKFIIVRTTNNRFRERKKSRLNVTHNMAAV